MNALSAGKPVLRLVACVLLLALLQSSAQAVVPAGKVLLGGSITPEELDRAYAETFPQTLKARGAAPTALPDVFGPGAVLRAGNVVMKITNVGLLGNGFPALSTDPSAQWPGQSGIEYLSLVALAVGGVEQVNGQTIRRVSFSTEWRPPSVDPEDKVYASYEGIVNGVRNFDDDGDGQIDEDPLDGRDNDGDHRVDEDYGALGQQMFSTVMTDWSPQSMSANRREQHVPLNIRVEQKAWAYSLTSPNLTNFDVIEYRIQNVSGNTIDSLFAGWFVDFDAGPAISSNYFRDDHDVPGYPQGKFSYDWTQGGQVDDPRVQFPHSAATTAPVDSPLCQRQEIRINGFSVADDDGDDNRTPGIPSFLLFNYTTDPLGQTGPARVQWRAYRSFTNGTPFNQGGLPLLDLETFQFMSSHENVGNEGESDGFITAEPGEQKGDYIAFCSVGPWLSVPNGGSITVTVGVAVDRGTLQLANTYGNAYSRYRAADASTQGSLGKQLLNTYSSLNNAFAAQLAYEGVYELNRHFPRPDFHGRETSMIAPRGQQFVVVEECGEESRSVLVTDREFSWFDLDCDYCTGIWSWERGQGSPEAARDAGYFHKTWNASSPPPSPATNASIAYNYTDNPDRHYVPGQDNSVTVAWDNLSEMSPDPAPPNLFDFRGYKVWKVAGWTRSAGSPGPGEEDWSLMGEFRLFDYLRPDGTPIANNRLPAPQPCAFPSGTVTSDIPCVYIPAVDSVQLVYLEHGDLWNQQTGQVIKPNTALDCVKLLNGECDSQSGCVIPPAHIDCVEQVRNRYPVGRYSLVDRAVKNGFTYFYSVTAFDSTNGSNGEALITESRRGAVEAEGVVPQASTRAGKNVTVVPNPYRGFSGIQQRPSSWDLTPNATDPTGTHIDFFGLPAGRWTIRIFTLSGDLVQVLHSDDAVNPSIRAPVTAPDGTTRPGYTRQQDTPTDGQARWNLISRNGQDIVSGVYLFTVNSNEGVQRGKFVVIR